LFWLYLQLDLFKHIFAVDIREDARSTYRYASSNADLRKPRKFFAKTYITSQAYKDGSKHNQQEIYELLGSLTKFRTVIEHRISSFY